LFFAFHNNFAALVIVADKVDYNESYLDKKINHKYLRHRRPPTIGYKAALVQGV